LKTLIQKIEEGKELLVHFYTTWCGTCSMQKPELKKFKDEFCSCVEIVEVNMDSDAHLLKHFHIKQLPTIILFKKGEEVWRNEGIIGAEEIKTAYQRHDVCHKFNHKL
jgi:thioredoxin 1